MNIHEYQAKQLFADAGVAVPNGTVAQSEQEFDQALSALPAGKPIVVKAQIHAGGRGKGTFKDGFQGGVHVRARKSVLMFRKVHLRSFIKRHGVLKKRLNLLMPIRESHGFLALIVSIHIIRLTRQRIISNGLIQIGCLCLPSIQKKDPLSQVFRYLIECGPTIIPENFIRRL
jgi:hypothetical protein